MDEKNKQKVGWYRTSVLTLKDTVSCVQAVSCVQTACKCLHTDTEIKHHTRANKFQGKTYQANSPATKEHTALSFKIQTAQSHPKTTDIS